MIATGSRQSFYQRLLKQSLSTHVQTVNATTKINLPFPRRHEPSWRAIACVDLMLTGSAKVIDLSISTSMMAGVRMEVSC